MENQILKNKYNGKSLQTPRLENIHKLIDSKKFDRDVISEQLGQVKLEFLGPYHQVYHFYLSAKLHFRYYQIDNAIEHLELASDLLDTMDTLAFEKKVRIYKDDYHFTRAYVKFVLSQLVWEEDSATYYLDKVKRITNKALTLNAQSKGFLWLKNQISA